MKPILTIGVCVLVAATLIGAQPSSPRKPYKVVFDLTTDDPQDHTAVIRWIREVASINPENERKMAKRANAKTIEVNSSHASYISHPKETAKLIEEAATSAPQK